MANVAHGGMDPPPPPKVTIVISPRERFEQAQMSLAAVFSTADVPYRLIYVDGGSPRPIGEALKSAVEGAGHRFIRTERYLSPNQARNLAMPHVDTDYVAFVDNDVIFEPHWLSRLIACAERTGAGLVTPTILVGSEHRIPDLKVHHAGGILRFERANERWTVFRRHGFEHRRYLDAREELTGGETGCTEFHVVLARRALLEEIGPFDERLFGFTDEVDMAILARRAGWAIWYEPSAVVTYAVGKAISARELPYYCLRWNTHLCMRAERYFYEKWRLVPDYQRQYDFLRDHRRHAFPFKGLQKLVGWRLTMAFTTALSDSIAGLFAWRIRIPPPPRRVVSMDPVASDEAAGDGVPGPDQAIAAAEGGRGLAAGEDVLGREAVQ